MGIPVKLSVELVPSTSHGANLRSVITSQEWKQVSAWCAHEANHVCQVCGGKSKGRNLDCHEKWHYDEETGTQTLIGLVGLCVSCHLVKHFGYAQVSGKEEFALFHLCKINKWNTYQARDYLEHCFKRFQRRSKIKWKLDCTFMEDVPVSISQESCKKLGIEYVQRPAYQVKAKKVGKF